MTQWKSDTEKELNFDPGGFGGGILRKSLTKKDLFHSTSKSYFETLLFTPIFKRSKLKNTSVVNFSRAIIVNLERMMMQKVLKVKTRSFRITYLIKT